MSHGVDHGLSDKELERIARILRKGFHPLDEYHGEERHAECARRRRIIEQVLAPAMLGEPPEWSLPNGYKLGRGAIFNAGAFCVYWGRDPDVSDPKKQFIALVHIRKEAHENGQNKRGAVGGYVETPEQTFMGVLREVAEEIRDPQKQPIFIPEMVEHGKVIGGMDYDKDPPVAYVGYACELSAEQIRRIKEHIHKFNTNDQYRAGCIAASGGETMGVEFMPLQDIVTLTPDAFMYSRQYDAYREIAKRLGVGASERQCPSTPVGYTEGDAASELHVGRIWTDKDGQRRYTNPYNHPDHLGRR